LAIIVFVTQKSEHGRNTNMDGTQLNSSDETCGCYAQVVKDWNEILSARLCYIVIAIMENQCSTHIVEQSPKGI